MSIMATAIYENGVLRLLQPLSLPESTRVRIQIEPETEYSLAGESHILYDLLALAEDLGVDDLAESSTITTCTVSKSNEASGFSRHRLHFSCDQYGG